MTTLWERMKQMNQTSGTKTTRNAQVTKMVLAALLLALGLVLPFVTGQIPEIGNMLLPMHLPVLICGLVCGWKWGLAVGFILPLLRSLLFQMPPLLPTLRTGGALCMAFELATYGLVAGLVYARLPRRTWALYAALIAAMAAGRMVWALASVVIYSLFSDIQFTFELFLAGGFVSAWPGMLLQLALIPLLVKALERTRLIPGGVAAE